MGEDAKKIGKAPDEKQPGKFHYNPGNMAGQEAGIVEENEKQKVNSHERDSEKNPNVKK